MTPQDVAPRAGAWIETATHASCTTLTGRSRLVQARGLKHCGDGGVVGAQPSRLVQARGLKLGYVLKGEQQTRSRLVQARGLKLLLLWGEALHDQVAPRAGAWIETWDSQNSRQSMRSRLVQARGLKRRRATR